MLMFASKIRRTLLPGIVQSFRQPSRSHYFPPKSSPPPTSRSAYTSVEQKSMSHDVLPQDILFDPPESYSCQNDARTLGPVNLEPFIPFILDHSQPRDEMYFFGSLVDSARRCYRTRVPPLVDLDPIGTAESTARFSDYLEQRVVCPIIDLFNRTRQFYIPPLHSMCTEFLQGDGVKYTFKAESETCSFPIFIFIIPGLLKVEEWRADSVQALSPASHAIMTEILPILLKDPSQQVIITDLRSYISLEGSDHGGSSISPPRFGCQVWAAPPGDYPTRVILAAFFPYRRYLDPNVDEGQKVKGALNNPRLPTPSDDNVLKRQSIDEFDLYTLLRSREQALQFLRWKVAIAKTLPHPIQIGDILSAETNGFVKRYHQGETGKPLEPLPEEIMQHVRANRRPCPLPASFLTHASRFSVRVDKVLKTANTGSKSASTFICSITSTTPHTPIPALTDLPRICLKVFDDSFCTVSTPDDNTDPGDWSDEYFTSQDLVRTEDRVYRSLEEVQGFMAPWYLGAHMFTLPDNRRALGILMEVVPGRSLDQLDAPLSQADIRVQTQFIQSCRHAVKVLQCLDISQLDWTLGQLMAVPVPSSPYYYAAMIDYSACTLTDSAYNALRVDDYGDVQNMLVSSTHGLGLEKELVRKWFQGRERWDYFLTDYTKL